jgi:hypothetical protein
VYALVLVPVLSEAVEPALSSFSLSLAQNPTMQLLSVSQLAQWVSVENSAAAAEPITNSQLPKKHCVSMSRSC